MTYNANYPVSADVLANPGVLTNRDDPGFELHGVISRMQDILEALEAKVGITASLPVAGGGVLRQTGAGASAWGQVQTVDLAAGQITQVRTARVSSPANNNTSSRVMIPSSATSAMTTVTGSSVLVILTMQALIINPAGFLDMYIYLDGAVEATALFEDATTARLTRTFAYVSVPAAGSHVWDVRWGPVAAGLTESATELRLTAIEYRR